MTTPDDQPHDAECSNSAEPGGSRQRTARRPHDPDARVSSKTAKSGKKEHFCGYSEHTVVAVPHLGQDTSAQPRLIVRAEMTGATQDVVDPTMSLIDRVPTDARPDRTVRRVIVDRHYSYKSVDRWKDELAERGIDQIADLRENELGFEDVDSVRWTAGWPHCPATPDHLGNAKAPEPSNKDPDAHEQFANAIDQRWIYAFDRHSLPGVDGKARWRCPAASGKCACPNQPGTVEAAVTLPGLVIVENAPTPDQPDFPKCCAQQVTTFVPPPSQRKLMGPEYYGSAAWRREYNKRTYVESTYGIRKNKSLEDIRRGSIRTTGLALTNIMYALAAATYNLRTLRNWHEQTGLGDPAHPLLAARPKTYGWKWCSEEEVADIDERFRPRRAADGAPEDGPLRDAA